MHALVCGRKKFKIVNNRVIGRSDFPTQTLMSRQHFEVSETEGRIYVTDLKSVNGTNVQGRRLKPNVATEIQEGEEFLAGGLTFKVAPASNIVFRERLIVAGGLFTALFLMLLCTPSNAFGQALGFVGLATVFSTLAIPFAIAMVFFQRLEKARAWSLSSYGAMVLATAVILNTLLVGAVDEQTSLGDMISVNRIVYFCTKNFNVDECTRQITSCPHCANSMGYDIRDEIVSRLKFHVRQPASSKTKK